MIGPAPRRRLLSVLALAAILPLLCGTGARAINPAQRVQSATPAQGPSGVAPTRPALTLLDQRTTGSITRFDVMATGVGAVGATTVEFRATVHAPVIDRDAFSRAADGTALGPVVSAIEIAAVTDAERTRGVALRSFDVDASLASGDGQHPVHIELSIGGVSAAQLTSFVTGASTRRADTPMNVALLVPVSLPTTTATAPAPDASSVVAIIETLASTADPLSIVVKPETLDTLSADALRGTATDAGTAVDTLRTALSGREVIAPLYVPWSPNEFADNRLHDVLTRHVALARATVVRRLGVEPVTDLLPAANQIPDDQALDAIGISRLIVSPSAISEDVPDHRRPFIVDPGARSGRETAARRTVVTDSQLQARLEHPGPDPLLSAHLLLAELAVIARGGIDAGPIGVVLAVPTTVGRPMLTVLTTQLRSAALQPSTVGQLFDLDLQTDADGAITYRTPSGRSAVPSVAAGTSLLASQERLDGYRSLFSATPDSAPTPARADDLRSLDHEAARLHAADLDAKQRTDAGRHFDALVEQRLGQIGLSGAHRITLTGRRQDVPLPVVNGTGDPVAVIVVVESDNLTLEGGRRDARILARTTLERSASIGTRIHVEPIPVSTRGPGSYSMLVRLRSPNGYEFSRVRYTVRSTAIGPVGKILTFGSLAVLALWWGRTIRRTRRRGALRRHPARTSGA